MKSPKRNESPQTRVRWYLQEWREHRGLTQAQLAEKISTSAGMVSDHESGERRFNEDWMGRWAYALEIEPIQLLMPPNETSADRSIEDAEAATLLRGLAAGGKIGEAKRYLRFLAQGDGDEGEPVADPSSADEPKPRKPQ